MANSSGSRAKAGVGATSIRYLPCQVEPGMFRGELLVYLHGFDPERVDQRIKVQMLADENEVVGLSGVPKRNQPVAGWVRVTLAREQPSGIAEVILPQPAQPVGETLVVDAKELKSTVVP
jgi:hypothetical protein